MRFNKWPFRRFSLSQLFVDIRNNSSKSFVCPVTSGGETPHTTAKCTLCSPPPLSLPGVRALLCRMCLLCTARIVWGPLQECAGPSLTRMGETAPPPRCSQDHRPITFSGKRWWDAGGQAAPGQCPHTCRPRLFGS